MEEAIISGSIALILSAIGYGRLVERIKNLKERIETTAGKVDVINTINVTLEGMKKDIHYIKKSLDHNEKGDGEDN